MKVASSVDMQQQDGETEDSSSMVDEDTDLKLEIYVAI